MKMAERFDTERRLEEIGLALRAEPSLVESVMAQVQTRPLPVRAPRIPLLERLFAPLRMMRLAPAMGGLLVGLVVLGWQVLGVREASAADVLRRAVVALSALRSVHLRVEMRTLPRDNFEMIGLEYDLVPIDLWKDFVTPPRGRWRIQKPGRVVVMDGQSSLLFIEPKSAARGGPDSGFVDLLRNLLDVHSVVYEALRLSLLPGSTAGRETVRGADGRAKTVVTVWVKAQGDFRNAWLRNRSIVEADTRRVYRFDAETHMLEGLEVWVRDAGREVLVLATRAITSNAAIDPSLFALDLPADVIWSRPPEPVRDVRLRNLTPRQVAEAFFSALAARRYDEALEFWPKQSFSDSMKEVYGGITVLSVGEPFRSGTYAGWFVPYSIRLASGRVKSWNVAVRNDNPYGRWQVDGGI